MRFGLRVSVPAIGALLALGQILGCAVGPDPKATEAAGSTTGDDADANANANADADADAEAGDDAGDDAGDPTPIDPPPDAGVVGATALLAEAESIVSSLTSTHYQHASNIDSSKGIFDVDCSGFVNFALAVSVSDAFGDLQLSTVKRPVAQSYVEFLSLLTAPKGRWQPVARAADLVPGDLLAWRIPSTVKSSDTGHVMVVETAPVVAAHEARIGIIDSTDTGHGSIDPRGSNGVSGVGRGTTVVVLREDGTATGYRWSPENGSPVLTTDVVMAHLD